MDSLAIKPVNNSLPQKTIEDYSTLFEFPKLPFSPLHFDALHEVLSSKILWQEDYYQAFDRKFFIPRRQAWYSDKGLRYRYSDNILSPQNWIDPLGQLRLMIQNITGHQFNSVLATQYRNGLDHVTWHSDDEKELGTSPVIASLTFGAARNFEFRQKSNPQIVGNLMLGHGDLIVMKPHFQHYWEHRVPQQVDITQERINLTFRFVYGDRLSL